jgi:hypothetical protein
MSFNHLSHILGLYSPPAPCAEEQFLTLQILGGYQIYRAKPCIPSDLGWSTEYRAYRIVIDTASPK